MRAVNQGFSLVITLSFLLVSAILVVSGMNSSLISERLSGNYKLMAQAQMAAEEAASEGVGSVKGNSSFLSFGGGDKVLWTGSNNGGCSEGSRCQYYFYNVEGGNVYGLAPGKYIASIGVVVDPSDGQSVLSASSPVFVNLVADDGGYGGISGALNIHGGIRGIDGNWYPTSENAAIGGELGVTVPCGGRDFCDSGDDIVFDVTSMYYEGTYFDVENRNNIKNKNVFPHGFDHAGTSQDVAEASLYWLQELANIVYIEAEAGSSNVIHYKSSSPSNSALKSEHFIGKDDTCVEYFFAVVDEFSSKAATGGGQSKFCGVVIVLEGSVDFKGGAFVEGVLLAANAELTALPDNEGYQLTQNTKDQTVEVKFAGGGGTGSVYFDRLSAEKAFDAIGEDYIRYFNIAGQGPPFATGYKIGNLWWQAP